MTPLLLDEYKTCGRRNCSWTTNTKHRTVPTGCQYILPKGFWILSTHIAQPLLIEIKEDVSFSSLLVHGGGVQRISNVNGQGSLKIEINGCVVMFPHPTTSHILPSLRWWVAIRVCTGKWKSLSSFIWRTYLLARKMTNYTVKCQHCSTLHFVWRCHINSKSGLFLLTHMALVYADRV